MDKLNPDALAETHAEAGAPPQDVRPGVQPVTWEMIYDYVSEELHNEYSRRAFADWVNSAWYDFADGDAVTNGQVIAGALEDWRGGKLAD